jgi:hypothetical protein
MTMLEFIESKSEADSAKDQKDCKFVHKSLGIKKSFLSTYVIAVAVNFDQSKNFINRISCKKGIPLGGYVYDAQSDCYFVECSDFFHLGILPFSFVLKGTDCGSWQSYVPMPESVIKANLTESQKKELKTFKNNFRSLNYKINYIQMVSPN